MTAQLACRPSRFTLANSDTKIYWLALVCYFTFFELVTALSTVAFKSAVDFAVVRESVSDQAAVPKADMKKQDMAEIHPVALRGEAAKRELARTLRFLAAASCWF